MWVWRDGSAFKSTCCSCRGLKFGCQPTPLSSPCSQLPVTPALRDWILTLLDFSHSALTRARSYIHVIKNKLLKTLKMSI